MSREETMLADPAVQAALKIHALVQERFAAGAEPYSGRRVLEPQSDGARKRPPMTASDVRRYVKERAPTLGFASNEVLRPMQGARNPRHDELKRVRRLLVAELVESGASLRVIGRRGKRDFPAELLLRASAALCGRSS
jgi:hypothetical protein